MVLNCVAYGCNNLQDKRKSISFHTFPFKRQEILELWIKAIRRENWAPTKTSRLCGEHFLHSNYQVIPGSTSKILKPDAVPSIFSYPKHLVTTAPLQRRKLIKHVTPILNKKNHVEPMDIDLPSTSTGSKMFVDKETQINLDTTVSTVLRRKVKTLKQKVKRCDLKLSSMKGVINEIRKSGHSKNEKLVAVLKNYIEEHSNAMEGKDKVDPSDVNKTPKIIKAAKEEIGKLDVLVCGECHEVFHYIEQFQEHKEKGKCSDPSMIRDLYKHEPKPQVWAFMIWKHAQFKKGSESENLPSSWTIYQQWCKLNTQAKETWIIAAENIQSFAKISTAKIQEIKNPPIVKNKVEKPSVQSVLIPKSNSAVENLPDEGEISLSKLLTSPEVNKNKQTNNRPGTIDSENDGEDESEEIIKNNNVNNKSVSKSKQSVNESLKDTKPTSGVLRKALRTGKDEVIEEAVVERILGRRINHRKRCPEYFIKWENFPDSENTWEPKIHLIKCPTLLEEFDNIIEKKKIAMKSVESQLEEMESDHNRPQRTSKQKALDQVKVWCGDISDGDEASGKRKSFSDDDSTDSFEKKMKFEDDSDSSEDEKPSVTIRRVPKSLSSINGIPKKTSDTTIPTTPKVVRVNQKQLPNLSSGVYIMSKTEGIIKLDSNNSSPGSPLLKVGSKIGQTHIKMVKKDEGVAGTTTKPGLTKSQATPDRKQLSIAPRGKVVALRKSLANPPSVKTVLKMAEPIPPEKSMDSKIDIPDEDSDGLEELEFPTDLPLPAPDSPPGEFTLCPLTGRVLGETDDIKEPEDSGVDTTSLDTLVQLAAADLPDVDLDARTTAKKENEREENLPTVKTVSDSSSLGETPINIVLDKTNPAEPAPSPKSTSGNMTTTTIATVTDLEASIKPTAIDKGTRIVLNLDDLASQSKTTESVPQKAAVTNVQVLPRPIKPAPPKKLLSTPSTVRQKVTTFQQRQTINRPVLPKPTPTTTIIHKVSPNRTKASISRRFHEPLLPMIRRTENVATYKPANVPKRIGNTTIYKTERPSPVQSIKKMPSTPASSPPVKSTATPTKPVPLSPTVINMPLLTTEEESASTVESSKNSQLAEIQTLPVASTDTTDISDLSTFNLNDSETPLLITGDDGTIYQVAGQNEEGQTILISEGPDGQQQCVIVSSECSTDEAILAGEPEQMDVDQPLCINTEVEPEGDGADSEESQVVAQIIKADPPSPGGTRKVVLMLPDGNLMMTDVTAEQYAALELDK